MEPLLDHTIDSRWVEEAWASVKLLMAMNPPGLPNDAFSATVCLKTIVSTYPSVQWEYRP